MFEKVAWWSEPVNKRSENYTVGVDMYFVLTDGKESGPILEQTVGKEHKIFY